MPPALIEEPAAKHGMIADIRGKGLFQTVAFVRDPATKERFPAARSFRIRVGHKALKHSLLCRFDRPWIAFGAAQIATGEQIGEMVAILDRGIADVFDESAADLATSLCVDRSLSQDRTTCRSVALRGKIV